MRASRAPTGYTSLGRSPDQAARSLAVIARGRLGRGARATGRRRAEQLVAANDALAQALQAWSGTLEASQEARYLRGAALASLAVRPGAVTRTVNFNSGSRSAIANRPLSSVVVRLAQSR